MVNHIDGDSLNNRLSNLEWVTGAENQQHAKRMGLRASKKGELHGRHKLSEIQVHEIRSKYMSKSYFYRELAKEYKVGISQVARIIRNEAWIHLDNGHGKIMASYI